MLLYIALGCGVISLLLLYAMPSLLLLTANVYTDPETGRTFYKPSVANLILTLVGGFLPVIGFAMAVVCIVLNRRPFFIQVSVVTLNLVATLIAWFGNRMVPFP